VGDEERSHEGRTSTQQEADQAAQQARRDPQGRFLAPHGHGRQEGSRQDGPARQAEAPPRVQGAGQGRAQGQGRRAQGQACQGAGRAQEARRGPQARARGRGEGAGLQAPRQVEQAQRVQARADDPGHRLGHPQLR